MTRFQIKRVYDEPAKSDGYRVLVDRLWPRGVSKEKAELDDWDKDIAPSSDLRIWFGHKPERLEEFAARYESELNDSAAVGAFLENTAGKEAVTLLYGAKDPIVNHAAVLKRFLEKKNPA